MNASQFPVCQRASLSCDARTTKVLPNPSTRVPRRDGYFLQLGEAASATSLCSVNQEDGQLGNSNRSIIRRQMALQIDSDTRFEEHLAARRLVGTGVYDHASAFPCNWTLATVNAPLAAVFAEGQPAAMHGL